jgi:thiamine-phosphate pyrophosphorylase
VEATRKINGGLYLVVDPALQLEFILPKIKQAIAGGIDVLQVWNNWSDGQNKQNIINAICNIAHASNIPVLINEEWQLLQTTQLDGVHFDNVPTGINAIRQTIAKPFIIGITCGNDLNRIIWANDNRLDYISFCSMFPSPSAGVCEIVKKETVIQARQLTPLPIFVAGGITLNNIEELEDISINGIALISGIMKADDAHATAKNFKEKLATLKVSSNETIANR